MSTVFTVANNTGFTNIINPFLPITHLFKKTKCFVIPCNKTNKLKYQNNVFFHSSQDTLCVSRFKKQLVSQMFWKLNRCVRTVGIGLVFGI